MFVFPRAQSPVDRLEKCGCRNRVGEKAEENFWPILFSLSLIGKYAYLLGSNLLKSALPGHRIKSYGLGNHGLNTVSHIHPCSVVAGYCLTIYLRTIPILAYLLLGEQNSIYHPYQYNLQTVVHQSRYASDILMLQHIFMFWFFFS